MNGLREATLSMAFAHTPEVPVCNITLRGHHGDEMGRFTAPVAMTNIHVPLSPAFQKALARLTQNCEWQFGHYRDAPEENLQSFIDCLKKCELTRGLLHHMAEADGPAVRLRVCGLFNDKPLDFNWEVCRESTLRVA